MVRRTDGETDTRAIDIHQCRGSLTLTPTILPEGGTCSPAAVQVKVSHLQVYSVPLTTTGGIPMSTGRCSYPPGTCTIVRVTKLHVLAFDWPLLGYK